MTDAESFLDGGQPTTDLTLPEVLLLLVGRDGTGRLATYQTDGPALDIYVEHGRIVDARWGPLPALSALEMAAMFLPRSRFVFVVGEHSPTRSFDLSPVDLSRRLADVARTGAAFAAAIPGPQAVPMPGQASGRRLAIDAEASRLLERIDGRRSVADLVDNRQPLLIVRGLANLVHLGAISFETNVNAPREQVAEAQALPDTAARGETGDPIAGQSRVRRWSVAAIALSSVVIFAAITIATRALQATPEVNGPVATPTVSVAGVQTAPAAQPEVGVSPTTLPPQPTLAPSPTALPAPSAAPTTGVAQAAPTPRVLLEQTFSSGAPGWPNAEGSSAFWDGAGYHLAPRVAGQHVAIPAPLDTSLSDVAVTGVFRKTGGPEGGGYGVIVRAQGTPLDGTSQGGRYYVFEVGDRGEIGAWRREEDHWVDLVTWTASAAVNAGIAENQLDVQARSAEFTFSVNNNQVAQFADDSLAAGGVGVFVGGDGNQVTLERFAVSDL